MRRKYASESWARCVGARSANIASLIYSLWGCDAYTINDLARVAEGWQQATVLKHVSSSHPWKALYFTGKAARNARKKKGETHCGAISLAGWSDASYGDQLTGGKCRLGYVIRLMPSPLTGPRHNLQRTPKFTRNLAKSQMVDHMTLIRDFQEPSEGSAPVTAGLEDCEGSFTHLSTKKIIAEKYST